MAREVNKLTAIAVARLKEPGQYGDGDGLYLVVDPTGAKRWRMLFRHDGRQREMGLGSANGVTLAEARRKRDEVRRALVNGRDPIAERRKPSTATKQAVTFGTFADQLIPELSKGFRNEKHKAQWTSTINTYASALRSKPIADISTDDVLSVLRPIWTEKSETASRLRGRIEKILDAAKAKGLRTAENPARWRGHLDHLLSKRKRLVQGHHPAMPFDQVPTFIAALRQREAIAALALEFSILTASRVSEVLGCRWAEIDRATRIWTLPGERMKGGREHRVPLSPRALEILSEVEPLRRGDFVFPTFRADKPLSNAAFDALMTRMGVTGATPHGFRSSFRDWAGETTNHPREVAEAALAHSTGNEVERAYRRGDALTKRRALMESWDAYLSGDRRTDERRDETSDVPADPR